MVTVFTEIPGEHPEPVGHGDGGLFAMVLRAETGGVATGNDGAAGDRTNGSAGKGVVERNADSGQAFDIGHGGAAFVVEAQPFR